MATVQAMQKVANIKEKRDQLYYDNRSVLVGCCSLAFCAFFFFLLNEDGSSALCGAFHKPQLEKWADPSCSYAFMASGIEKSQSHHFEEGFKPVISGCAA